jgi:hypothetical protein
MIRFDFPLLHEIEEVVTAACAKVWNVSGAKRIDFFNVCK